MEYRTLTLILLVTLFYSASVSSAPVDTATPTRLPSHNRLQGRSFKVKRVANPNFTERNGPKQLLKAYRKYGIYIPEGLAEASDRVAEESKARHGNGNGNGKGNGHGNAASSSSASQTGSAGTASSSSSSSSSSSTSSNNTDGDTGEVTATPEANDVEYLAPIDIGGQTLNMDFDTGSSDLWVFNTDLPKRLTTGHTLFDPAQSPTFQTLKGASFKISYGDGSEAAGTVGTDTVNIGGASVTSQAVQLATAVSGSFIQDVQSNGLVGLAFSSLNTVKPQQQKTFFDNALDTLAEPVFTADLRAGSAAGSYEFGTIDSTKFSGDSLNWAAVDSSSGFWQFSSERFVVGNGQIQTSPGAQAIADTGTTLMLANADVVNAYYSQVDGAVNNATAGGITFPCDADLPDLAVDVGGGYLAEVSGDLINFSKAGDGMCFGGLQATTGDLQIYGDILFKAQFVAFNGGNSSIGMAPHA